ncbi:galactose mutarotase [bacterium]|nr:galactose mutarotase [bacterium]RQV99156.1 MAG: galactose mutarotase [bacterium]
MNIHKSSFGKTETDVQIDLYKLTNDLGMKVGIITYGSIVASIEVPDREGNVEDIVLGFDQLEGYLKGNSPHFGGIIGRYANRIKKGQFKINGVEYHLTVNDGPNHLHGGFRGFDRVVWNAESFETEDVVGVKLHYLSHDGEEGYPGDLSCMITYSLTNDNALQMIYEATTNKPTPVNLTNHTYFNLASQSAGSVLNHELFVMADTYTPVDKNMIPVGDIRSVKNTPLDFTKPRKIGERIDKMDKGYDHNLVLAKGDEKLDLAARVWEPTSGRAMEIHTTEPGVQFYTGNYLDGSVVGKDSTRYQPHGGFCLEMQHFPDSPNQSKFPSTILNEGDKYTQFTLFKFYTS